MIHTSAIIESSSVIGREVNIWAFSHIRERVEIGRGSNIGERVYIGPGVKIGENCKIQNGALIYEPAVVENFVFVGPGAILTNDKRPRATRIDGSKKTDDDWTSEGVHLSEGCSIGAGAVVLPSIRIGKWSIVGAGSVVTKNVSDFSLTMGNPSNHIAWVGRSGERLVGLGMGKWECPISKEIYVEKGDFLFLHV